jgi:DNA-binding CsgD family transcriptional regulator
MDDLDSPLDSARALTALPKRQLLLLLDLIDSCTRVEDQAGINAIIDRFEGLVPFEEAIICSFSNEVTGNALHDVINHSYTSEWVSTYLGNRFSSVDPVLAESVTGSHTFSWEDAYRRHAHRLRTQEAHFTEAAMDFGYVRGYTSSVTLKDDNTSYLISVKSDHDLAPAQVETLHLIAPHLARASHTIVEQRRNNARDNALQKLSHRELEVLHWAVAGKTAVEISYILAISERTVKFHFNNIYQKLGVTNRSHAVATAVNFGLVSLQQ